MTTFQIPVAEHLSPRTDAVRLLDRVRSHIPAATFYALDITPASTVTVDTCKKSVTFSDAALAGAHPIAGAIMVFEREDSLFDVEIHPTDSPVRIEHRALDGEGLAGVFAELAGQQHG